MQSIDPNSVDPAQNQSSGATLYDLLGGRPSLERVHKKFYDRVFNHPVLGAFFETKPQEIQENQQTDFLAGEFGGPRIYCGRLPGDAHQHLFITDEHFELRHAILAAVLDECGIAPELRDRWLAVDRRFKSQIVKQTIDDCRKRYNKDTIIVAPAV